MESDIVHRLRDLAEINESDPAMLPSESKILREAAAEIDRLRVKVSKKVGELAAMQKQRDDARGQTWYLLYDGTSEDGMGTGAYIGRTTDKEVARKHHAKCRKSPYNIGFVEIVTDTQKTHVSYYGTELQSVKEGGGA